MSGMKLGLAEHLRNLADKVEHGDLCNGEVWERLYADGPVPVDYTAGPVETPGTKDTDRDGGDGA
jgi:hypothetical protein